MKVSEIYETKKKFAEVKVGDFLVSDGGGDAIYQLVFNHASGRLGLLDLRGGLVIGKSILHDGGIVTKQQIEEMTNGPLVGWCVMNAKAAGNFLAGSSYPKGEPLVSDGVAHPPLKAGDIVTHDQSGMKYIIMRVVGNEIGRICIQSSMPLSGHLLSRVQVANPDSLTKEESYKILSGGGDLHNWSREHVAWQKAA